MIYVNKADIGFYRFSKIGIVFETNTAWKMSVFGVFLFYIFPHSEWIPRDTPYLSVFNPNAKKYGPEKLRIRTLFTQSSVSDRETLSPVPGKAFQ